MPTARRKRRSRRSYYAHAAPALNHVSSRDGIIGIWRDIQRVVYSKRVLVGLPSFATRLARTFWDVEPSQVVRAITNGDPAFFMAYLIRVDQIDQAMLDAGLTVPDRAPLIRIRFLLDGFREAAEANLVKHYGGKKLDTAVPV